MEHIISVLVENKFGVLARVAGLFSARGYNIESLSVAPTLDPTTSMITIVTQGEERVIEQIIKQLNKVIEVMKVTDLTETSFLDRETALIKISAKDDHRDEAMRIAEIFRAKIVDSSSTTYTIEVTGDVDKVEALINMLKPLGIKDLLVKSGLAKSGSDAWRAVDQGAVSIDGMKIVERMHRQPLTSIFVLRLGKKMIRVVPRGAASAGA